MIPLPAGGGDPLELADWLEVNALVGKAGQISLDDLRDALRTGGIGLRSGMSPAEHAIQLESLAGSVLAEIRLRSGLAGDGYPFRLKSSSLELGAAADVRWNSTYAFCLMLSYLSWKDKKLSGVFPERHFEEVSCLVAERYIAGKSVRFGWPRGRSPLPSKFDKAVNALCARLGEGSGYLSANAHEQEKDASLDVVAWRPIDNRTGKLILFGACATGADWETKLTELQPGDFCQTYIFGLASEIPTKAFFTPRVVPENRWRSYSIKAGIIFDRCRVSVLAPNLPSTKRHGDMQNWMRLAAKKVDP